jgi:hypothetical protein
MYYLRAIQYSFMVRLLALHFRNHLLLIGLWVFLAALTTGLAGRFFGLHYLLLTPEYQGKVGGWSFFLTGAAFGILVIIWNLTTYLLAADRFPFLATLSAPFTKFCINNSLIPLAYLVTYLSSAIWFMVHDELIRSSEIVVNIASFLAGFLAFVLFLAVYMHFTNKDLASVLRTGKFVPKPGGRLLLTSQRLPTLQEIRSGATRWRVDTYLTERLHVRLVRSVAHYDADILARVFRQNHFNAIIVQGVALLLLLLQGYFMDVLWLRFPTSVSILVLASMVLAIFGAITYWFRQWGTLIFLLIVGIVNVLTSKGYMNYRNQLYGLSYSARQRAPYNYAVLDSLSSDSLVLADKANMLEILNTWQTTRSASMDGRKPKLVFVCVSGGGHRAALWTIRSLQQANKATDGRLLRHSILITGASGGMLGAAYLREVMLRQHYRERVSVSDSTLFQEMGRDLLNPITAALVANDIFYPTRSVEIAGQTYLKDRGFYFERQMNANLRGYFDHSLSWYAQPEREAVIPMMIVSPYIINDGRRLLISPHGVSFMSKPPEIGRHTIGSEQDGVDFRRLMSGHQPDSLMFTSALRANCTFPYILPNPWLPTNPTLELMDAGIRDNFGITGAVRFIHAFEDWIRENTSGVVIVQVRCWEKLHHISALDEKGIVSSLLTPASTAGMIPIMQDYEHDVSLALLDDLLGKNRLEVIRFTYKPVRQQRAASLSFHLSRREKLDVWQAWDLEDNQKAVEQLKKALR